MEYIDNNQIPPGTKVPRPVVTLSYKHDRHGTIVGHKVRCSYPGNRIIPGLHYDPDAVSTYAADRDAVRLVLALSVTNKLDLYHIDLTSAFIHEQYDGLTPLYIKPFPQFDGTPRHKGKVGKIVRNIWGTPHAPRTYIKGLHQHLINNGYSKSKADHNVYTTHTSSFTLIMAITIDDFCVATNSETLYNTLLKHLADKYRVKNIGRARHIIGWSLTKDSDTGSLHITQPYLAQTYIDLLKMNDAHLTRSPYPSGIKLHGPTAAEETLDISRHPYAKAVGILRYIVDSTRPDLAYVVGSLARHKKSPTTCHWKLLKHIERYLNATLHHGLCYHRGPSTLSAQSEADFAGCSDTRQSTHSSLIYLGNCLISWCSRRIKSAVTNTFAAE